MGIISLAVIKLSLVTLLGFYLYRRNFIEANSLKFLTFFVINFSVPFLIFSHLIENLRGVSLDKVGIFLLLSLAVFLTGFFLGFIFSFKIPHYRREFISGVSFQNCGYLPMNIAFFLFPAGLKEKFLVYVFLYMLGFDIIFWSVGSFFILKNKGEKFLLKSLLTPPIISSILALILIYFRATLFIPALIIAVLKMVGDTSFVLSMLILGSWLAKINAENLYKRAFTLGWLSFLKLIMMPLIFSFFIIKFEIFSLLGLFIILQASMPSAASLPIVVNLRGANSEFISQGVFLTHLLSIFTIPFWLGIFLRISGFTF